MNATLRKVEEGLRPWARGKPITLDTELYRDLGMYGDDLAFDVVLWATREFGVEGLSTSATTPQENRISGRSRGCCAN
jgi:hypothetical protein